MKKESDRTPGLLHRIPVKAWIPEPRQCRDSARHFPESCTPPLFSTRRCRAISASCRSPSQTCLNRVRIEPNGINFCLHWAPRGRPGPADRAGPQPVWAPQRTRSLSRLGPLWFVSHCVPARPASWTARVFCETGGRRRVRWRQRPVHHVIPARCDDLRTKGQHAAS